MKVAFPLVKVYKVGKNSSVNIIFQRQETDMFLGGCVGGARKWDGKEATAMNW